MNRSIKVLYAEDDDSLREVFSDLLNLEGIVCTQARNGLEAIEALKKESFDLVLSDFQMPELDGAELLFWCRKNHIHIPFIFISANIERLPKEVLALNDCCSAYVNKPVSFEVLLKAIEEAMTKNHDFECRVKVEDHVDETGFVFKNKHTLKANQ